MANHTSLGISQREADRATAPFRRRSGDAQDGAEGGGGADGPARSLFWKVVAMIALPLLAWIGTQLMAVPAHGIEIRSIDRRLVVVEEWRVEKDRRDQQAATATDELIRLLKAEQAEHAAASKRRR